MVLMTPSSKKIEPPTGSGRSTLLVFLFCIALALTLSACGMSDQEIGFAVRDSMQKTFDSDTSLKQYKLVVGTVRVVKKSGSSYKGIANVDYDGTPHDVPIDVTADGQNVLWEAPPGSFLFIAQHEFQKALTGSNDSTTAAPEDDRVTVAPSSAPDEGDGCDAPCRDAAAASLLRSKTVDTLHSMENSSAAMQDPRKVRLMECMGDKIYKDGSYPAGWTPPTEPECATLEAALLHADPGKPTSIQTHSETNATDAIAAPAQPVPRPFWCPKAATKVEIMICGDDDLSALDNKMYGVYKIAEAKAVNKKAFYAAARNWRDGVRNMCDSESCLVTAYQVHIDELANSP